MHWTRLWSQAQVREEDKLPWCQVSRSQEAWQVKDPETGPRCWTPTVQEPPWMRRPSRRSSCPSWLVAPPTIFLHSFCLTPRRWMEYNIIRQWIESNEQFQKCVKWAVSKIFVESHEQIEKYLLLSLLWAVCIMFQMSRFKQICWVESHE